ncbi:MAG: 16S rRNA processing protein RimM [Ruminococcaceae bacterium]|nr:16S rRNA processing protein RimM [Oscillospiraceae bacterium]
MLLSYLELGQIVGTHGIKGELRVQPWCDSFEFFESFKNIYLSKDDKNPYKVLGVRPHGNIVLLTLAGVDDVEMANTFCSKIIYIKREDAKIEKGRYFIAELIGCRVMDVDTKREYGIVKDVINHGASDIWHIQSNDGKDYYLPSIPGVVVEIDVASDLALVRPIKGIFEEAEGIHEN